jgi:hypothetical protein
MFHGAHLAALIVLAIVVALAVSAAYITYRDLYRGAR